MASRPSLAADSRPEGFAPKTVIGKLARDCEGREIAELPVGMAVGEIALPGVE
jgi:hypothetical protein